MTRAARALSIVTLRGTLGYLLGCCAVLAIGVSVLVRVVGVGAGHAYAFGGAAAGVVLLIALPVVLWVSWEMTGRHVRDIAAMRSGEALVHWRYDARGWRRANRLEARRFRRAARAPAVTGLVVAGLAAAAALFVPDPAARRGALVAAGLIALGVPALYALHRSTSIRRRAGEVYISALGVYRRPGGYRPLDGYNQRLRRMSLVDGPAGAHLSFVVATMQNAGLADKRSTVDVAVPAGREDEARRLVERLRAEVLDPRDAKAAEPPEQRSRGLLDAIPDIPDVTWP